MTQPRRPAMPAPATAQGVRLAKRVAELRSCSRREAEQFIEGGWVTVDGQLVEEPAFRVGAQTVLVASNASAISLAPVTVLLHKPAGFADGTAPAPSAPVPAQTPACSVRELLVPANRSPQDASGVRLLKRHLRDLDAPVALEFGASGLVVFTQDWRVARKLHEDALVIEHEVIVDVAGDVAPDVLRRLNHGLQSDGAPLPRVKVSVNSASAGLSKLRFAIKGSHPGLLAYLCERVGLRILGMKRIRVGRVLLSTLAVGQWRFLLAHEQF